VKRKTTYEENGKKYTKIHSWNEEVKHWGSFERGVKELDLRMIDGVICYANRVSGSAYSCFIPLKQEILWVPFSPDSDKISGLKRDINKFKNETIKLLSTLTLQHQEFVKKNRTVSPWAEQSTVEDMDKTLTKSIKMIDALTRKFQSHEIDSTKHKINFLDK
jgi:hypothetical protein